MKKLLYLLSVFIVVASLLSSSAQALTPIGPPVATLERGQLAAGFTYGQAEGDIKGTVLGFELVVEDIEVKTYMANLFLGLDDSVELQIDLGGSRYDDVDYCSSGNFTGGFGVKATLSKQDKLKFGVAFMMHWYEANGSGVTMGIPWTEKDDWTEIQVAIGPSFEDGPWRLYGGPFLHFIDGEAEGTIAGIPVSGDFEEDSNVGGFAGLQVDLDDNTTLGFEYQQTGSANVFGASIRFRF